MVAVIFCARGLIYDRTETSHMQSQDGIVVALLHLRSINVAGNELVYSWIGAEENWRVLS